MLDWNEPSIGFYGSLGAVTMDEWTVFRLDGAALESLARDGALRRTISSGPLTTPRPLADQQRNARHDRAGR